MRLPNISVSAEDAFTTCQKKWYNSYILRKRKQNNARSLGNEIHEAVELYQKGESVDGHAQEHMVKLAIDAGLMQTPADPEWAVEQWANTQCGPLAFKGKVDAFRVVDNVLLTIDDTKSTSGGKEGPWQWTKGEEELAHAKQPLTYAKAIVLANDLTPPETFDARHINYYTASRDDRFPDYPMVQEICAPDIPWKRVEENWRHFERVAQEMYDLYYAAESVDDVPAAEDKDACNAYGGCPHAAYCSDYRGWRQVNQENKEETERAMGGVLDGLAEDLFGPPATATEVPAAKAPEPEKTGSLDAAVTGVKPVLESEGKVPEAVLNNVAEGQGLYPFQLMQALGLRLVDGAYVPKEPEAPEPEVVVQETKPEVKVLVEASEEAQVRDAWQALGEANGWPLASRKVKEAVASVTCLKVIRTTRIKGYLGEQFVLLDDGKLDLADRSGLPEPVRPREEVAASEVLPVLPPESASKALIEGIERARQGLETPVPANAAAYVSLSVDRLILVDTVAVPASWEPVNFARWVQPFIDEVEKDGGKIEGKWIAPLPHYAMMDYNAGADRVIAELKAETKNPEGLPRVMTVDSRHPLASKFLAVTEGWGVIVLRGLR